MALHPASRSDSLRQSQAEANPSLLHQSLEDLAGHLEFDIDGLRKRYRDERDRRVRPEGNSQYRRAKGVFQHFADDPWIKGDTTRAPITSHTSVLILGGGWGGLLTGARLAEKGIHDVRIVDIAGDFGGTWYWNRYPGAMCDIEAHVYLPLLEELGYAPQHRYSYGPELLEHARRIGTAYNLYENALFQTSIKSAEWDTERALWRIETDRQDQLSADFFILAGGRQSLPKLPNVPGLENFQGHIFHSSRWDYGYTGGDPTGGLTGLRERSVGIVGTGATALQIVPAVAADAQHLYVFQRTPSTVAPRDNYPTGSSHVADQSPGWQRRRRINFQQLCRFSSTSAVDRPPVDEVGDSWTDLFGKLVELDIRTLRAVLGREPTDDELAFLAEVADFRVMNGIRARIDDVVSDPTVADRLKPWYRWQCKRPGFHDDYLSSFNRPNVHLVDTHGSGIKEFTRDGLIVGGSQYKLDCLIMATGFEAGISYTHLIGFDPVGLDGVRLSEHWSRGVRTLHGIAIDRFPNFLIVGSNPQTAAAVNAVHILDEQAIHVAHIISVMLARGLTVIVPNASSVNEYVEMIEGDPRVESMLNFYQDCTPGYYNAEGKAEKGDQLFLGGRFPDGPIAYYEFLDRWRREGDFAGMTIVDAHQ